MGLPLPPPITANEIVCLSFKSRSGWGASILRGAFGIHYHGICLNASPGDKYLFQTRSRDAETERWVADLISCLRGVLHTMNFLDPEDRVRPRRSLHVFNGPNLKIRNDVIVFDFPDSVLIAELVHGIGPQIRGHHVQRLRQFLSGV